MGSLPSPARPDPTQLVYCAFRFTDPNRIESIRIQSYHTPDNAWSYVTSIPDLDEHRGLRDFAMVSLGGSIYVIGGRSSEPGRVSAAVRRYDLRSGSWSRCGSLATARYDFACSVCDGKIYVAGGKSAEASPTGLASAELYDPAVDRWAALPSMTRLRYKCAAVTWRGRVHVVGGFALKPGLAAAPVNSVAERSSAEAFDTRLGRWEPLAGMWQLDVPPNQIVAVDGRLLSSGDCLKVWKGHVEAYDWEQNIWNEVEGSNNGALMTQELYYLTIAPIGAYLYFVAGYRVGGEIPRTKSIVHRFDTSATSDAWTSYEPIEEDGEKLLCSHCCVAQAS